MNDPFASDPQPGSGSTDFFSSGSPSCRFTNIGDMHQGDIVDFEETQQRDIKTGELTKWPDGNPKMMLVITLQTTERDAEIDDDDGQRRLYVNKPSGMFAAIKNAIGKEKFAIGGSLAVKYTGNGKPKTPGFSPPKEYAAKYIPAGGAAHTAAPSHNGFWSFEVAVQKAMDAGITQPELVAELKKAGLNSYNAQRDTTRIKALIAAKSNPIGDEVQFAEADIPF